MTQKQRFIAMLVLDVICVFTAFGAIFAHVTLHQVWGLPLFALAMIIGFGAQIWFVVGLVKASRLEKGI